MALSSFSPAYDLAVPEAIMPLKSVLTTSQHCAQPPRAAIVYPAETPRSRPMFTVCRWSDRVALFVQ